MPLLFYLDQVDSVSNASPIHPNPKHPDSNVIAVTLAQTKESKMARTRLPSHLSHHERLPKKYRWSASSALVTATVSH